MPTWDGVAEGAASGCLVKPIMLQFIQDEEISFQFKLHLERSGNRAPDGWFHASTHPMATDRELWLYLARPDLIVPEERSYSMKMAALMGTVLHGVVEAALDRMGVSVPLPGGNCPACGRAYLPKGRQQSEKFCLEHGAADPATRARCHMDSVLNFRPQGMYGFDLKSIYPFGLKGVQEMDAGYFQGKWPKYWHQMQECMRVSGLRQYIVLFMSWGSPWEMREFHIPYDPAHNSLTEAKYRRVITAYESGQEILESAA